MRSASVSESTDSRPIGAGLRAVLVVGFVVMAVVLAPSPYDAGLVHRSVGVVAGALAIHALVGVALLCLIGTLELARRTRHGGASTWLEATTATTALALAMGVLVLIAGGRVAANQLHAVGPPASRPTGAAISPRTQAARQWSFRMTPVMLTLSTPWRVDQRFRARLRQGASPIALKRIAARQQGRFRGLSARLHALPRPSIPVLKRTTATIERSVGLFAAAYRDYRAALGHAAQRGVASLPAERRSLARANTEDRGARALARQLPGRLYALNRLFYGR